MLGSRGAGAVGGAAAPAESEPLPQPQTAPDAPAHLPPDDAPHVFFPVSSDSALAAEAICRRLVEAQVPPDRLCMLWPLGYLREPSLPPGMLRLDLPPDALVREAPLREALKRFAIARWWRRARAQHPELLARPAHWYIAHPAWLPANRAAFGPKQASLSLLPDGMANFAAVPAVPAGLGGALRHGLRQTLEAVAAASAGFAWRPILSGHKIQHTRMPLTRSYCFETEGLVTGVGEILVLERPGHRWRVPPNPRLAVIADQELSELVDPSVEAALRARLIEAVNGLDLDRVIYKKHPRAAGRIEDYRARIRHPVLAPDRSGPVEEVVAETGAGVLVSHWSTCLVTLADLDGLRRIAVMPAAMAAGTSKASAASPGDAIRRSGAEIVAPATDDGGPI